MTAGLIFTDRSLTTKVTSTVKLELWKDPDGYLFCFAGPMGEQARSLLPDEATIIWTVEAKSHHEAMTKYYEYMNWGEYSSDFPQDKELFPTEWETTQQLP